MPAGRLHPLSLLFSTIEIAKQLIVPAFLGGVSTGDDFEEIFTRGFIILAVLAVGAAAFQYLRFRFALTDDALVIDSGVFGRRRRVIPFSRIQTINIHRSALQRLFGVAELRVETATTGQEAEAALRVLSRDDARDLRASLLARRRAAGPAGHGEALAEAGRPALITRLEPSDLALAGATASEAGIIALLLAAGFQYVDQFVRPLVEGWLEALNVDAEAVAELLPEGALGIAIAVIGIVLFLLLAAWLLSIVGALLRYWGFTLEREGDDLRKRYGALGRREASVPVDRVQAVRIEESLIRRPFGLAALRIETAGATTGRAGGGAEAMMTAGGPEAFVPIARARDVPRLVHALFSQVDYGAVTLRKVHPRGRWRLFVRYAFYVVLATTALAIFTGAPGLLGLGGLVPAAGLAQWQYVNRGWTMVPGHVIIRSGVWNRITWIVPVRKIQTLHVREAPFQRRHGLATLMVDTAAGGRAAVASAVDIADRDARELLDRLVMATRRSAA